MPTRICTIRGLLVLALVAPLGLLAVGPPLAPAGLRPAPPDPARARRDAIRAEGRGLLDRRGRYTLLKARERGSGRFVSVLQAHGFYVLTVHAPRRLLDPPARARLARVLERA